MGGGEPGIGTPGSLGISALGYLGLLPSVAQPPLPLQEFLPLQPASLVLQPPWPLQAFCPLQEWVPFSFRHRLERDSSLSGCVGCIGANRERPGHESGHRGARDECFRCVHLVFWFLAFELPKLRQ